MPSSHILLSNVTDFIGAPLSECSTNGSCKHCSPMTSPRCPLALGISAHDDHPGGGAELEPDLLIERPQQGLTRAKAEGKKLGRPQAMYVSPSPANTCANIFGLMGAVALPGP
jgi:hypothetical protein